MDEEKKDGDDDDDIDEMDEKAKKKAEKAAKKARKAEKEEKKMAKLQGKVSGSDEDGSKDAADAEDKMEEGGDEDEVFYGAPDDHAWTDSSHAIKDAANNKDDGPDTSVSIYIYTHILIV